MVDWSFVHEPTVCPSPGSPRSPTSPPRGEVYVALPPLPSGERSASGASRVRGRPSVSSGWQSHSRVSSLPCMRHTETRHGNTIRHVAVHYFAAGTARLTARGAASRTKCGIALAWHTPCSKIGNNQEQRQITEDTANETGTTPALLSAPPVIRGPLAASAGGVSLCHPCFHPWS